ncbi:hypothetical protein [Aeromonas dhakensis]|uniref:hypothetical protein n=1 Tax=Aeromonas dhakensis TaxID=196024 RepID=UPI0013DE6988|nr:hypothetical protein [Aeromonas dhakensis]
MITETMIYFIGIPAIIAYLLLILAYFDKMKNDNSILKFPLRDAAIATLALDFSVLIPQLFEQSSIGILTDGLNLLSVITLLFFFHLSILFYSRKLEVIMEYNAKSSYKKRIIALVLPMYAGLLCLMTNGVSIEAMLAAKGGF